MISHALRFLIASLVSVLLGACASQMELGKGGSMVTGTAGAAGTQGATQALPRCNKPLGTAALVEPEAQAMSLLSMVGLRSPVPLLRLMMAQSNCFRVIDRGAALGGIQTEQYLSGFGMLQRGSVTARGRMVAAQYLITPNVIFSNPNAGGYGGGLGMLGAFAGPAGVLAGAIASSMRIQEAQTALFLTDAQSGEQIAATEGSARATDFSGGDGLLGFGGGIAGLGGIGGYGNTAEGKLIAAALLDAYSKLVAQVQATQPNLSASVASKSHKKAKRHRQRHEDSEMGEASL